jgi:hypothetical protein
MARTTPTVRDGYLEWQAGETHERLAVGTPAWFAWLEQHTTFAYLTPSGGVTVRRDRGQRGGWYWRAYLRVAPGHPGRWAGCGPLPSLPRSGPSSCA